MSHDQEHQTDPSAARKGYMVGNDYALPYVSRWSREQATLGMPRVLKHLSCSYFSTPGQPPTLLALKQHAQSLAYAISLLCPSVKAAGEINSAGNDGNGDDAGDASTVAGQQHTIEMNEAMDWLRSLTIPYTNDDPNHHRLLYSLLNEVRAHHDVVGTDYNCALASCGDPRLPGERVQPYASHHNLLMHANACLERLDHELSATGGLLSVLPTDRSTDSDSPEMAGARNSLMGQWLLFTQTLVGRMHDLELAYANALDALAGEVVAPLQQLSALGADGRAQPRPLVGHPQDRWLLANAGDDVFDYLHRELDRAEAVAEERDAVWRERGGLGERLWVQNGGGREFARGLVHIDVSTRYLRLKSGAGSSSSSTTQSRGPIFVIPAWDHHPGVAHTKTLESPARPTVVTVPGPAFFPEHASALEDRYRAELEEAAKVRDDNAAMAARLRTLDAEVGSLSRDAVRQRELNAALQQAVGRDAALLAAEVARLKRQLREVRTKGSEELRTRLAAEEAKVKALVVERDVVRSEARKAGVRIGDGV